MSEEVVDIRVAVKPSVEEEYTSFVKNQILKYSLDCYITFECDEHLNDEFLGDDDRRVYYLTGFSEGIAVSSSKPCLIANSMNYSQAKEASRYPVIEGKLSDIISEKGYIRISFSRKYISHDRYVELLKKLKEKNSSLEFVITDEDNNVERAVNGKVFSLDEENIEDYIPYKDNPNEPISKYLKSHNFVYTTSNIAGISYSEKIRKVREKANSMNVKWMIFAELDIICWILNIRGADIKHFPVIYAYLAVSQERTVLFSNHKVKLNGVEEVEYARFPSFLEDIRDEKVGIGGECNEWIYSQLSDVSFTSHFSDLKAIKNDTELYGMTLSYVFDSLAIVELFGYMQEHDGYTERDILNKMEEIRSRVDGYICPSFESICASGKNAANIHNKTSNRVVDKKKVFLLDTGSHYLFGTTDTSRTILLDESCIDKRIIHDATLVLKGHINGMMRKYAPNDNYNEIDKEGRRFLQLEGKDFAHSTGHGVGHCLNVHENPPIITIRKTSNIHPRHIFSVEPGIYIEGEYGVRFENLVYTREDENDKAIECVNLTMVPYQRALIDAAMLSESEKEYLNNHNTACYELLSKYCSPAALDWLTKNTAKIL